MNAKQTNNANAPEATMKKRNAQDAYNTHRANIASLIDQLNAHLAADAESLERKRTNWADVGDLAQIEEYLQNAVDFATGSEE